jgi:hypothetical protein
MTLYCINTSRNENACRRISSVPSALSGLRTDDINTNVERLLDVFWVANHVHDGDAGLVEFLDSLLGRDTNGADKKCRFLLDDDVDELRKLALCVVELRGTRFSPDSPLCSLNLTFVFLAFPPT